MQDRSIFPAALAPCSILGSYELGNVQDTDANELRQHTRNTGSTSAAASEEYSITEADAMTAIFEDTADTECSKGLAYEMQVHREVCYHKTSRPDARWGWSSAGCLLRGCVGHASCCDRAAPNAVVCIRMQPNVFLQPTCLRFACTCCSKRATAQNVSWGLLLCRPRRDLSSRMA